MRLLRYDLFITLTLVVTFFAACNPEHRDSSKKGEYETKSTEKSRDLARRLVSETSRNATGSGATSSNYSCLVRKVNTDKKEFELGQVLVERDVDPEESTDYLYADENRVYAFSLGEEVEGDGIQLMSIATHLIDEQGGAHLESYASGDQSQVVHLLDAPNGVFVICRNKASHESLSADLVLKGYHKAL